jgi:signal transduction histidine kinase
MQPPRNDAPHAPRYIDVETARRRLERGRRDAVARLDALLRADLAAAKAYAAATAVIARPELAAAVAQNRSSHAVRAVALIQALERMNARARESAGLWGAFTRAVARAAALVGENALATFLRELEHHSLELHNSALESIVDPEARELVLDHLLPEQMQNRMRLDEVLEPAFDSNDAQTWSRP